MGWAGCGCKQCTEYEDAKFMLETLGRNRGESRPPIQLASTGTSATFDRLLKSPSPVWRWRDVEIQPDEWVGAA